MSTEVTKFDPATYVDKVRDKIKQSLTSSPSSGTRCSRPKSRASNNQ